MTKKRVVTVFNVAFSIIVYFSCKMLAAECRTLSNAEAHRWPRGPSV